MTRYLVRPLLFAAGPSLVALFAGCGSGDDEPAGAKTDGLRADRRRLRAELGEGPRRPDHLQRRKRRNVEGERVRGAGRGHDPGREGEPLRRPLGQFLADPGARRIHPLLPRWRRREGHVDRQRQAEAKSSLLVEAAASQYRDYLERNTEELVAATAPFVAAVEAGDVEEAKALYAQARIPYERIEPVAESFGDLDPRIDARTNDVEPDQFGGFHEIEQALWEKDTTARMAPVAKRLLANVEELRNKAKRVQLQAVQIANGANELLGEVSASKITGEEERYSHIDLVDFEANVEGSQAAFEAIEPLISTKDPKPAKEIEAQFDKVYASLKPYRRGDGLVPYTELTHADTRKLAQEIDALAELLSEVPALIVSG